MDSNAIPLSLAHVQQNLRLLELPEPLLKLLVSPNPPVLSVKSKPPPVTAGAAASSAVLCTADKTYELRLLRPSNSVHLTRPVLCGDQPTAITAIARCDSVLELLSVAETPVAALRAAVSGIWCSERWDGDTAAECSGDSIPMAKEGVVADTPFSDVECEQAWVELCAFECRGHSVIPSLPTLWRCWSTILNTAVAEGIDLGAQFQMAHLANVLGAAGECIQPELVKAICRRLRPDDQTADDDWAAVDRAKCVPWVGRNLLAAHDHTTTRLTADFLHTWKDALPEDWRNDARLEAIKDDCVFPSHDTIAPKGTHPPSRTPASTGKGARKWHEKLKAARQR